MASLRCATASADVRAEKVAQDEALSNKLAILTSIPGIAETTAFSMLIEMPELGTLEGKQAASLAGLAPMSRQSGKWQGKERIQRGRAFLRRANAHLRDGRTWSELRP
jgi:transposase